MSKWYTNSSESWISASNPSAWKPSASSAAPSTSSGQTLSSTLVPSSSLLADPTTLKSLKGKEKVTQNTKLQPSSASLKFPNLSSTPGSLQGGWEAYSSRDAASDSAMGSSQFKSIWEIDTTKVYGELSSEPSPTPAIPATPATPSTPSTPSTQPLSSSTSPSSPTTVSSSSTSTPKSKRNIDIEAELTKQNLYKTELCQSWAETGVCRYGTKCQFAHGENELRPVLRHPKYKTEVCKTFGIHGHCPYGKRCRFVHQLSELRPEPEWNEDTAELQMKFNELNLLLEPEEEEVSKSAKKSSRLPTLMKLSKQKF